MVVDMGSSPPRIVIVDDDPTQLCIAELFLMDDHDVRCFTDAREALFAILHDLPDAIISDIHMPGMGGIALQEALERADVHLPFVFLTGDDFAQGLSDTAGNALVEWLPKPIDKAQLRECVARVLRHDGRLSPKLH